MCSERGTHVKTDFTFHLFVSYGEIVKPPNFYFSIYSGIVFNSNLDDFLLNKVLLLLFFFLNNYDIYELLFPQYIHFVYH